MTARLTALSVAFALACGNSATGSEADAEIEVVGKEDSYRAELVLGEFRNAAGAPRTGEFESLVLTEVDVSELPAVHFEGAFELVEQTESGQRTSTGHFNVYRYAGENWIRFLDSAADDYVTEHEKYSWTVNDGQLVLQGHHASDAFVMAPVDAPTTTYVCDDYDTNPFGVDVSDALRSTPAELLLEVTAANLADASDFYGQLGAVATKLELGTIEELLDAVDENVLYVYDVSYGQVAYEWVRFYQGDTEVGYLFDAGFDEPIAEVSDGDIFGCRADVCDYSYRSPVSEDSATLLADPVATLVTTLESGASIASSTEAQLRAGIGLLYGEDTADDTIDELLDFADEGTIWVYDIEGGYDWLSFYAGDTEVGVMFEAGTTVPVATVGDTEITGCREE